MLVQKLKNQFSNKSAPGVDVSKKVGVALVLFRLLTSITKININIQIMKTEVVRHIFDGGKLNRTGTEEPHRNVVQEGRSCPSFRSLLGQDEVQTEIGSQILHLYINYAYIQDLCLSVTIRKLMENLNWPKSNLLQHIQVI